MVCAQLAGEIFLVIAASDSDRSESHARGKLHAEMAEATDPEDGDERASARERIAKGVESGHTGAEQRARFNRVEAIGDAGDGTEWSNDIVGIAPIEMNPRNQHILAGHEVAATTRLAMAAIAAEPADANTIAHLPFGRGGISESVNDARDFVAGNSGKLDTRPDAFDGDDIAVTDAAGIDPDADLAAARIGDRAFDEFERTMGFRDLHNAHLHD